MYIFEIICLVVYVLSGIVTFFALSSLEQEIARDLQIRVSKVHALINILSVFPLVNTFITWYVLRAGLVWLSGWVKANVSKGWRAFFFIIVFVICSMLLGCTPCQGDGKGPIRVKVCYSQTGDCEEVRTYVKPYLSSHGCLVCNTVPIRCGVRSVEVIN